MTTSSDDQAILDRHVPQIDPYWFSRPEQEIRAYVEARVEAWASVPGYGRYEWSDKGRVRVGFIDGYNGDRVPGGQLMKTSVQNNGYAKVNVVRDDGKSVTVTVHKMVLLAHHPSFYGLAAFPAGLETRHNPSTGPLFNAYPEGVWPGTKLENAADKFTGGKQRAVPAAPRSCPSCGAVILQRGRGRCKDCVVAAGRKAAAMLGRGMSLGEVTHRLGYQGDRWVHEMAQEHGGYAGTLDEARAQRMPRRHRAWLTLRDILRGDGQ